jgi:hypothetical protein
LSKENMARTIDDETRAAIIQELQGLQTKVKNVTETITAAGNLLERCRTALVDERIEVHGSSCWCEFGKKSLGHKSRPVGHNLYCLQRAEIMLALDSVLR